MPSIHIDLQNKSYDIRIGSDLKSEISEVIQELEYKHRSIILVTDKNITKSQEQFINEVFDGAPKLVFPAGEKSKSLESLVKGYDFLIDHNMDRTSTLFAIGGGVIGDLGGFIASTYMRGIDYYQIPTSLLAMVDSSVGGKTGINLKAGKNMVGAFYQPKEVFVNTDFLKTLPEREFTSGLAEIIKYGLLSNLEFFEFLESTPPVTADSPEIESIIERSCSIKAQIVQEDERDQSGKRALLNLGHTFAHAIEKAAGYGEYLHGEAVAIGMVLAARLSELLGYLSEKDFQRVKDLIAKYGLPTKLNKPISIPELNTAMHHDKKAEGGHLHFILLKKLGDAFEEKGVDEKWLHLLWREIDAKD